ncbi:MAG: baseplate tail-tube junction protein [Clostridiales bacterium]|nr:baseplate tail-tube junction protein [Clostridiales bacterium]
MSVAGTAAESMWDSGKKFLTEFSDVGNPALGGKNPTWMDNIWLPLPNEIGESLSHQYNESTGLLNTLTGGGAKGVVDGLVTTPSDIISKATGTQALIFNENKLAQFEGSDFRSITLSWTLIANNPKEARSIQEIITKLKAFSSPQAVSGKLLLRAPFFCRLEFPNKIIDEALQFRETVMTSIDVNYSVTGYMETFRDDMPKTISLSITFKDREPKTLQAWAKGQSGYEYGGGTGQNDVPASPKPGSGHDSQNNTSVTPGGTGMGVKPIVDMRPAAEAIR